MTEHDELLATIAVRRLRVMSVVVFLAIFGTLVTSEGAGIPLTAVTIVYNLLALALVGTIGASAWLRRTSQRFAVVALTLIWLVPVGGTMISQHESGQAQLVVLVLIELVALCVLLDTPQTIAAAVLSLGAYLPLLVRDSTSFTLHLSVLVTAAVFGVVLQIVTRRTLVHANQHRIAQAATASKLAQNLADLEQSDAERARLQERLFHAQRLESIATLAAGIAHDMNNVLAAITNHAHVIAEQPVEPSSAKIQTVIEQALRGSELTRALLAFSRRGRYRKELTKVADLVSDSVSTVEGGLAGHCEVVTAHGAGDATIEGDRVQLRQVLVNLCVNARDATVGAGTIVVSSNQVELGEDEARTHGLPAGPYVLLHVTDSGTGIDEQTREHLFEPFFTTKPLGKGTGLGLAFVWGVAQAHGGTVTVDSELGRGSRFTVYLPRTLAAPLAVSAPSRYRTSTSTVLVIDDEVAVRNSTSRMLQRKGYRVLVAENGARGLEVFSEHAHEIGLVILDMGMPVMGGAECFAHLRAQSDVPVLIATGYAVDADIQDMMARGASLIEKPYHPRDLVEEIERITAKDGPGLKVPRDSDANLTPP